MKGRSVGDDYIPAQLLLLTAVAVISFLTLVSVRTSPVRSPREVVVDTLYLSPRDAGCVVTYGPLPTSEDAKRVAVGLVCEEEKLGRWW